jgi:crotonobetainyl-CoA:carnitine CoA-transferase CaiB-like acyl-CoA transferase
VSNERIWHRFCAAIERPDLLDDPRFRSNANRVRHIDALEAEVGAWFGAHDAAAIQRVLDEAGVPICPIYSMADIFRDPHYAAREDVAWIDDPAAGSVPMPNVVPRFSETPGAIRHTGPPLGEHNAEVYGGLLGLDDAALEQLRTDGII